MCKIICVTNRRLCRDDFYERLSWICASGIDTVILREKDLTSEKYAVLAEKLSKICADNGTEFIQHTFMSDTMTGIIHLPMPLLRNTDDRKHFRTIGTSIHSVAEAQEAQRLGASYITAGHIFDTDCKAGLPGRGLGFLQEVCSSVTIPVYAIGGITPDNAGAVIKAGASGICVMSSLMTCDNVTEYISRLRREMNEH